jgi:hypothetical protein
MPSVLPEQEGAMIHARITGSAIIFNPGDIYSGGIPSEKLEHDC